MNEFVKIKCDDCKFEPECADYGWLGCKKFTPAQSTPMTNEEWFNTLSTEEKAEFMGDIWGRGYLTSHFEGNFGKKQDKAYWVEWLKQPHTVKE